MRKTLLFISVLFIFHLGYSQTANFYADSALLRVYAGNQGLFERYMQMQWQINGKPLAFGGDTVKIIPNGKRIDTVLFRQNNTAKWDTIICNITQPHTYNFVLNTCCGGFDVQNQTLNKRPSGKAIFNLQQKSIGIYVGMLGETGIQAKLNSRDTITPLCRSVMSPNVYCIELRKVERCQKKSDCNGDDNLECFTENGHDPTYEMPFRTKNLICRFLYMPLDNTPIKISYLPVAKVLKIE